MKPQQKKPLDTTIEISTPENIEFSYTLAGPFRRLPAYLFDLLMIMLIIAFGGLIVLILAVVFSSFGSFFSSLFFGFYLIFIFIVTWFYRGIFETCWKGQTPGKRLFGLRVLTIDGQPINMFQAFLRNVLAAADLFPYFFNAVPLGTAGFLVCCTNRRFQRLGDLAGGTMVVVENKVYSLQKDLVRFTHPQVLKMAELIPMTLNVPPSLEKAISLYVHRRKSLPPLRREEIAAYLAVPLLESLTMPKNVNPDLFLCGLYQKILGE